MRNKVVGVIPARAGSKRLPNKNKLLLAGKPLILWTIEAALESEVFDEIIVSSDDSEILEIARKIRGVTALVRPKALSDDNSSSMDVLAHALAHLEKSGRAFDTLVLLQPTSPLRNSAHIRSAYEHFVLKSANSVVSVSLVDHPIEWCTTLSDDLSMDDFVKSSFLGMRSQDLPETYRINGAIYIIKIPVFMVSHCFLVEGTYAFIMGKAASVDIDDEFDLRLAESFMKMGAL